MATLPFPLSYKLNATEQQNSGLLDQLLGEGEISARVLLSDGKEQRIQETVLRASGVYVNITLTSNGLPMKLSLARSGEHLADASAAADYTRIAATTGGIDEWRLYRA